MSQFDSDTVSKVYDFLGHENETEIRLIDPLKVRPTRSILVDSRAQFVEACLKYNSIYNVYAGINERRPGGTKKEDVLTVKTVVVDIDALRPEKSQPAAENELKLAYQVAGQIAVDSEAFGFYRPAICMSGNGYQCWFAIPTIRITDENRDEVERHLQLFQRLVKARYDSEVASIDNIGDLPRVIKVIGTLSVKGLPTPARPHRLSYALEPLVRREDPYLKEYIMSLELPSPQYEPQAHLHTVKVSNFADLLRRDEKLRQLYQGNIPSYPSRSEAEMALVCKLVWYGFPKDTVWQIMDGCAIGKWKESRDQYRELTYSKAIRYSGT